VSCFDNEELQAAANRLDSSDFEQDKWPHLKERLIMRKICTVRQA
jgi:hypothetical protein